MTEQERTHQPEVRPARVSPEPDWRRLEISQRRFGRYITDGIAAALGGGTEIDEGTARCIAHVLGRAFGPESNLADFGRTGEASYIDIRDEYLALYTDPAAGAATKESIDWLGTYFVSRLPASSGRVFTNERVSLHLDLLLVATTIQVGGQPFTVHFPANLDSQQITDITETLTLLQLDQDEALQAFLSLPDVSAGVVDIMQSFDEAFIGTYQSEEHALRVLSPLEDWENQLADWCINQGIEPEAVEWNLQPLIARLHDVYDLVDWKGQIHGFVR